MFQKLNRKKTLHVLAFSVLAISSAFGTGTSVQAKTASETTMAQSDVWQAPVAVLRPQRDPVPKPPEPESHHMFFVDRGIVTAVPTDIVTAPFGDYMVGSNVYQAVSSTTDFQALAGPIGVGSCVRVNYTMQGSMRVASLITSLNLGECYRSQRDRGVVMTRPVSSLYGEWSVNGHSYAAISGTTTFDEHFGPLSVGSCAGVSYATIGGQSVALLVVSLAAPECSSLLALRDVGPITVVPTGTTLFGDWVINGNTYTAVSGTTTFEQNNGPLEVGTCAGVLYTKGANGNVTMRIASIRPSMCFTVQRAHGTVVSMPVGSDFGGWMIGEVGYLAIQGVTTFDRGDDLMRSNDGGHGGGHDNNASIKVGDCIGVAFVVSADRNVALELEKEDHDGCARQEHHVAFGTIMTLPTSIDLTGTWNVGGRSFEVVTSTVLEGGPFTPTMLVKVEWISTGGINVAVEISGRTTMTDSEHERVKIRGVLQSRPITPTIAGTWVVASTTLIVSDTTRVDGSLAISDCVEAYFRQAANGDNIAVSIGRADDCGTATELARKYGFVRSMPMSATLGIWVIGGTSFSVTASTLVSETNGPVMIGSFVRIVFERSGKGPKIALSVETLPAPGPWTRQLLGRLKISRSAVARGEAAVPSYSVNGRTILVNDATMIDTSAGQLTNGQPVMVSLKINTITGQAQASSITVLTALHSVFMPTVSN